MDAAFSGTLLGTWKIKTYLAVEHVDTEAESIGCHDVGQPVVEIGKELCWV